VDFYAGLQTRRLVGRGNKPKWQGHPTNNSCDAGWLWRSWHWSGNQHRFWRGLRIRGIALVIAVLNLAALVRLVIGLATVFLRLRLVAMHWAYIAGTAALFRESVS